VGLWLGLGFGSGLVEFNYA